MSTSTHPLLGSRLRAPAPIPRLVVCPPPELERDLERHEYERRFGVLAVPTEVQLSGRFRAHLLGPKWLKLLAVHGFRRVGLGNAWGIELQGFGPAQHLFGRGGKQRGFPLALGLTNSAFDNRLCAVITQEDASKSRVRHELRVAGDKCLLGLCRIDAAFVRGLVFPFVLVRAD